MRVQPARLALLIGIVTATQCVLAGDGNRLSYLEENNPWYPHTGLARLTTPQWVGEEGVEAVVILAIDDMRETAKYETYLRPILQRLKAIDGRAPVSIMTCNVKPDDPQLQSWLGEGLSIECHTVDHPCPLLQGGDFEKAKSTYDRCVDLLHEIPGNTPVAFRTPCCDSLNTVSPRFFSEIFNSQTPGGHHLQIDSSVFCVFTEDDPEIPAELLRDPDGTPKFQKYFPTGLERGDVVHNQFVNWIENYPYPYVINDTCWEFPCMVPSDWEANFYHEPNNPDTVRDMKTALDITVLKQGVFCMVFHPHGWIEAQQMIEFIDHAVETYGEKVKFLTFREAWQRLNENLFPSEKWIRTDQVIAQHRILDLNDDGYMDVIIGGEQDLMGPDFQSPLTRIWNAETNSWQEMVFPTPLSSWHHHGRAHLGARFGGLRRDGSASLFTDQLSREFGVWNFTDGQWRRVESGYEGVPLEENFLFPWACSGIRLRDLDFDGITELLNGSEEQSGIYEFDFNGTGWKRLPFTFPEEMVIVALETSDDGYTTCCDQVRFIDINQDQRLDIVQSNHERYGIWLFKDMQTGWSIEVVSGTRGDHPPEEELPPIVRADGSDNGFFIHSGYLLWQNEETGHLPDMVEKRSIAELLGVEAD